MYKQKGPQGFAPILIVFLIALVVGGYLFYQNQQKSQQKPASSTQQATPPTAYPSVAVAMPVYSDQWNAFIKAHDAKYPKPSSQPVPAGLEDELFNVFSKDQIAIKANWAGQTRNTFTMTGFEGGYYGDVAEGGVRCIQLNGESCGGASWVMNKTSDGWKVIYLGQQDADDCENLKKFLNDLKPWQGVCWDDERKGLVDILHPNEVYNNY